jgi:peroxiredoxin
MSLEKRLRDRSEQFSLETPAQTVAAMLRADLALVSAGIAEHALKAGDQALDFTLTDVRGSTVSLSSLRKSGPVVMSFYRGDWCPYCTLELEALTDLYPGIAGLGASLVAISPQKMHLPAQEIPFLLACDPGSKVARDYGLAFSLPDELQAIYQQFGHPLSEMNAAADWVLPIPATYVVAQDGRIVLSFVDVDYRRRLEPTEIVTVLSGLRKTRRSLWRA